ncbi:MAG: CarD family transcriptional regulator [Proteobacteria bacterium]|nr:CarD family transcriptional regulator [Pseudomonadota bacterium]
MSTVQIKDGEFVVYPAHGVGKLVGRETHEIAGTKVVLLVILFEKERMTLRLPESKAILAGLRSLVSKDGMLEALDLLKVKTRVKKAMWSRRAQEYETKINSGDLKNIAEVLRELFRSSKDTEQSYSERQIYQAALERFTRELSIVEQINEQEAASYVENLLNVA